MAETIDSVYRDWKTPGNPASGEYKPEKPRIRALLRQMQGQSGQAITRNTLAALNAVTPPTEFYMGIVLNDPVASNNGYYYRSAGAWVKGRGFPDSFARLTGVGGTANTVTAGVDAGVSPADIGLFQFTPILTNTGPMTLAVAGGAAKPLLTFDGQQLEAGFVIGGAAVLLYDDGMGNYRLFLDHRFEVLSAQTLQARDEAVQAKNDAEAALDALDDRWLGAKASDPTTDNDGDALIDGALYWNTISKVFRAWDAGTSEWYSIRYSYAGAWSPVPVYPPNTLVEYGGSIWSALRENTNVEPVEGDDWSLFLPGVTVADGTITDPKVYSPPSANLAISAAKIGFQPRGSNGGFYRILQDRVEDFINAMDYALGEPIHDNASRPLSNYFASLESAQEIFPFAASLTDELAWAAIQKAVHVAGSNAFGAVVLLPRGRINLGTNTIRVPYNYVALFGQGYQSTVIHRSATSGYAIHFGWDAPANIFYQGLFSVQVLSTVKMTSGGLVWFDISSHSMIRDVRLQNGFINLNLRSVHDFHVENVNGVHGNLYGFGEAYINLRFDCLTSGSHNPNNQAWVSNSNFRSRDTDDPYVQHGIHIESADGIWFDHCHVGNATVANVRIIPKSGTTQLSGLTFSNCWFDQGTTGRHVYANGATSATFGYFQFADCYITGGLDGTEGYRFDASAGSAIRNVEITGGKVMNLNGPGFIANRLEGFTITGTQFRGVGTGGGVNGITIGASCKRFTITGVGCGYNAALTATSAADYGLAIAAGADGYVVTGNDFQGNTIGGISDGGGPNKVVANNLT